MGPSFEDYQQARREANNYARSTRRIWRYTPRYLVFTGINLFVTLLIAPQLAFPSLLANILIYGVYFYGSSLLTKIKHWELNRQATEVSEDNSQGSLTQPLLPVTNRKSRHELQFHANNEITDALTHKNSRITYYAQTANFIDKHPMSYSDRKNQRALFQYSMLERAKEEALKGNEGFIDELAYDKTERRDLKITMLKRLLEDFLVLGKVVITLKHLKGRPDCECLVTGDKETLMSALEEMNACLPPLVPLPSGLSKLEKEQFFFNSLLPILLDMDAVIQTVPGTTGQVAGYRLRKILFLDEYSISKEYVEWRVKQLEKPRQGILYSLTVTS